MMCKLFSFTVHIINSRVFNNQTYKRHDHKTRPYIIFICNYQYRDRRSYLNRSDENKNKNIKSKIEIKMILKKRMIDFFVVSIDTNFFSSSFVLQDISLKYLFETFLGYLRSFDETYFGSFIEICEENKNVFCLVVIIISDVR